MTEKCFALASAFLFATLLGLHAESAFSATISGNVRYENLLFPENGHGPTDAVDWRPIRNATVQVVLFETPQSVVASGLTDENGDYSIQVNDALGVRYVFVRVLAEQNNIRLKTRIVNSSNVTYAMASTTSELDLSQPHQIDLTAERSSRLGGAFNIFDQALIGSDYTKALEGIAPPFLTFKWYSGLSGTYFSSSERKIQLTSIDGVDTDEYDDDVILHEFSHAVADAFSEDNSPGGPHSIRQTNDIRLTWSEGFATFYSGLIRSESDYIDTANLYDSDEAILLAYEFETPAFPVTSVGSNNELAVQASLWDVFDGGTGDDDPISAPVQQFWQIFTENFNTTREGQMADFYDGWWDQGFADFESVTSVMDSFKMEFTRGQGDASDRTPVDAFLPVPDGSTAGTQVVLSIDRDAVIERVRVYVSLVGYSSDLKVSLISPSGTKVLLTDSSLSGLDLAWYGPSTFPSPDESLDAFNGESSAGTWRLEVVDADNDGQIVQLRRWELIVTGTGGLPGDLDGNGTINRTDLFTFSVEWQVPDSSVKPSSEKADTNNDGVVDKSDLQMLYDYWHLSE